MYYLRTRPAAQAIQFTVDQKVVQQARQKENVDPESKVDCEKEEEAMACSFKNKEACMSCSA